MSRTVTKYPINMVTEESRQLLELMKEREENVLKSIQELDELLIVLW